MPGLSVTLFSESMNSMNSSGPRIEPWGTPEVTLKGVDDAPSRTTAL